MLDNGSDSVTPCMKFRETFLPTEVFLTGTCNGPEKASVVSVIRDDTAVEEPENADTLCRMLSDEELLTIDGLEEIKISLLLPWLLLSPLPLA